MHLRQGSSLSNIRSGGIFALVPLLALLAAMSADAATASTSYTYDLVGRVTSALYDNGVCVVYAYDVNGNRTSQTNTVGGTPTSPIWGSGTWGCFLWTP
jgi:YD repeat-containing protein